MIARKKRLMMLMAQSGGLPLGYTRVEYIEGTGTQYIDIDSTMKEYEWEIEARITGTSSVQRCMTGYYGDSDAQANAIMQNATYFYILRRNGSSSSTNDAYVNTSVFINEKLTFKCYKKYAEIVVPAGSTARYAKNNTELATLHEIPVSLFRCGAGNSTYTGRRMVARFYYAKFILNDRIAYELVPCIRNSDGVAGVFDLIGRQFYTNSGTGEFIIPT